MSSAPVFRPALLALAVSLGLAGSVIAQFATPTAAQRQEIETARADLERAATRLAELSRRYGLPHGSPVRIERKVVRKPMLGVLLGTHAQGVQIAGVTPDSAAAAAGLRSGDVITAIDGRAIAGQTPEARQLAAQSRLAEIKADTPVRLAYRRDGQELQASVTPKLDRRVFLLDQRDGTLSKIGGDVLIRRGPGGEMEIEGKSFEVEPGHPDDIHEMRTEIRRGDCKGEDCHRPVLLAEAFRWNGLNLASVDAQLGRYFGADSGVLVLSAGPLLAPLQSGDVIRSIDGKTVTTPREAMAALRAKPAGSTVDVSYLRDRKPARLQVKVPPAMPLPMPPPPPAPPAPPVPPAPPAPGASMRNIQRLTTEIAGEDGGITTVVEEMDRPLSSVPPAPPVPPPPPPTPR